jgi:glycosyltransferase involved in cell wall biosynthesis
VGKKPLISILTPVFNQRAHIKQTIRSVLDQTYQDWEWIILDDGSTDGTGDIIRSFKERRIKYAYQEHAGITQLTKTYNKALIMCKSDFIAMLDHDDYWPDYKLEVQIKGFDDPGVVLGYGECLIVNQRGKKIGYMGIPDDMSTAHNEPMGSALKMLLLQRYCFIINSTVMLRKSALAAIGGFVETKGLFHDYPTWIRLSLEGRFSAIPRCLGYWRRHPSSVSIRSDPAFLFDAGLNVLREFVLQNKKRLNDLGFFYDMNRIEENWENIRSEFIAYLPYNRAMLLLRMGSFKDAKTEFKKFLEKYPSPKNKFIYYLILCSAFMNFDMVNPLAKMKEKI